MRQVRKPLRVGIMGAGRMAQGFDQPGDHSILTLAHAVGACPAFRLGGFFDLNAKRAEEAERKWGCPASPRDRTTWLDQSWDVVCIATPDAQHAVDFRDVLARKPKAILTEKPLTLQREDAVALLREANRAGVPVLVDFPRRWHTGVAAVSECIAQRRLGKPLAATFVYSGDAAHSAIHMLDLFYAWWGGGWEASLESRRDRSTHLTFSRGGDVVAASFVNLPAEPYYVWEMQVYCEKGKIELSHSPETLDINEPRPHPLYPSFHVLTPVKSFQMEAEPLLVRMMETLAAMIADPDTARAQAKREMDSQAFSDQVLRWLETASVAGLTTGGAGACRR
jgi:predicted dehydrogenase